MAQDISPPPLKRREVHQTDDTPRVDNGNASDSSDDSVSIRVFSWNVNGIQAFIPQSFKPITAFFKTVSQGTSTKNDDQSEEAPKTVPLNSIRSFLSRHNWPEALFVQELKISPNDRTTESALLSTLNTPFTSHDRLSPQTTYNLHLNLPRDKFNVKGFGGKLYGVGTILRSDFASEYVTRVRGPDWDLEGRVTIVELSHIASGPVTGVIQVPGVDSSPKASVNPLALINVYAVNGTTAPYHDPHTGTVAGTRHDHKLAFHTRLRDECLQLEREGFGVLVAGDLNVARGLLDGYPNLRTWPAQHCVNRADFNQKFFLREDNELAQAYIGSEVGRTKGKQERGAENTGSANATGEASCFDGVDVFRALKGRERRYTYYPRSRDWGASCDRVDLIIASRRMWEGNVVLDTGILDTPQERGPSDHVPLWVNLQLGKKD